MSLLNNKLIQSNTLITASYQISLQEKRLIIAILGKYNQKKLPRICEISVSEFSTIFQGIKIDFYTELIKTVRLLYNRDIKYYDDKNRPIQQFRWVSSIKYDYDHSRVILAWSPEIMPLISELKTQFTQIKIKEIVKLKSVYSIRLFELIQEKKDFGEFSISVTDFRKMFKLSRKYKIFAELRRRVIEPAIKEIFIKNDLKISFHAEKMGRSYKNLYFTWNKKVNIPERLKITKVTNFDEPNLFDDNSK